MRSFAVFASLLLCPLLAPALIVPHFDSDLDRPTTSPHAADLLPLEHPLDRRQVKPTTAAAAASADAEEKATTIVTEKSMPTASAISSPPTRSAVSAAHSAIKSPAIHSASTPVRSPAASPKAESSESKPASQSKSGNKSSSTSETSTSIYSKPAKPTSVNTDNTLSQGSDVPVECNQGCANTYALIGQCNSDSGSCIALCDYLTYTQTVKCLNCLISYSAPGVNSTDLGDMLENINGLCEGTTAKVRSTGMVTAKPTATGDVTPFDTAIAQTQRPTMTNRGRFVQQSTGAGYINEAGSVAVLGAFAGALGLLL